MKKFTNHDYTISQSLDYGLDKFITSKQNFVDLMIQYIIEEVCSVDNTRSLDIEMSLEKPSAMSIEFLCQHVLTIAHVAINMNFNKRQQVSKKEEKRQIIKTLTLKQKVKCHFMKSCDCISEGDKQYSDFLFFSTSRFLLVFVSRMSVEESFVEKLKRQFRGKL
jgi:hypothetical protein